MRKTILILFTFMAFISLHVNMTDIHTQCSTSKDKCVQISKSINNATNLYNPEQDFHVDIIVRKPEEVITNTSEVIVTMSEEDIELIALVTMAEAEGECDNGKRLVIDTVLNRVDSEHFPDNVYDVIYQKNQFSAMWNDRVNRVTVTDDVRELVREELISRTNSNVMFFNAGKHSNYGVPSIVVGNHYFSNYE